MSSRLLIDLPPTTDVYQFDGDDYRIIRDLITVIRSRIQRAAMGDADMLPAAQASLTRLDKMMDLAVIVKEADNG